MITRLLFAMLLWIPARAQITSITDGAWTDSSTWDCLCVPDSGVVVVVEHEVSIVGDLLFYFDSVFVAPDASLWMPDTNFIIVFGKIQNDGLMDMRGHFDIIGDMAGPGTTIMHGIFHNFGELTMEPGCQINVDGDLVNEGIITGDGSICISSLTYNNGLLSGLIDFCDLTPSTTVAPIIDVNSGTVTDDVTYCTNSVCWTGVNDHVTRSLAVHPLPAVEEVVLSGAEAVERIRVMDVHGRGVSVIWRRNGDQVILERGRLPDGIYFVQLLDRSGTTTAFARVLFTSR